jgi:hypothetical protein
MKKIYERPELAINNAYSIKTNICQGSQGGWIESKQRNNFNEEEAQSKNKEPWGNIW